MRQKKQRARWGRSFWAKAEMTELHVVADLWGKESKSLCEESLSEFKGSDVAFNNPEVKLHIEKKQITVQNGIIRVTFSNPEGTILGISYNGINNVLEGRNNFNNRGNPRLCRYFDIVWNSPGAPSKLWGIEGSRFSVIEANENEVELSFSRTWNKDNSSPPLNIDKRYILRRGSSGLYIYGIFEHPEDFPATEIDHVRIVFKLQKERFQYMAIADDRQRLMPTAEDRSTGQRLDYDEAALITNPSNPKLRGEVDDKYQYSCENKDNKVHGWINLDSKTNKSVGFWMITPSNEFRSGGPIRQGLTSHVGPVTLNILHTTHYSGKEVTMTLHEGEPFKKVYGPVFAYLNSVSRVHHSEQVLWSDAVQQLSEEINRWPYDFPKSEDFVPTNKRGRVEGQLFVQDRHIKGGNFLYGENAHIGLAVPGDVGSWQRQSKGYQFWTQADKLGHFTIENIVPGDYNLYAWIPGIFGDYRYNTTITITSGCIVQLGSLIYNPPRNGPTLWEIGIPDRSAAEFHVPNPYPNLINRLYIAKPLHKFRQYGLWKRYNELYPNEDLTYTVGVSDYSKDWFYAQVPRNIGNNSFHPTVWEIKFDLPFVMRGIYTLRLALASATRSNLMVRFNNPVARPPHFSTGLIGQDNAIARHGIHGLYWPYSIEVGSNVLVEGSNTIYLRQTKAMSPFQGIMYDYIRLERPEA
ncbi:probable rhamnogalacturonate lyase B [Vigna radiata var. radiata]|uniref:rhamnogalacturonan endolyase n=1 Tax=Vigna radiata var. radiata TaxID=3916 RepID=A0A3Q0F7S2_VIGRR|nr:probable rhamnogalacturonate lyase B [Vigna radiata var. radiata]